MPTAEGCQGEAPLGVPCVGWDSCYNTERLALCAAVVAPGDWRSPAQWLSSGGHANSP